ncbi:MULTISPECIES: DUF1611 domain-containing protein [Aliivibrio]|uniref:DUF1611 domain-containing protein n=1 Tax=Aliivibrio finisterrensis TaxID=511998 RepID=A0A4Q5KY83_9GAMM|nr:MULTISPECIES: DUF1611 domain-containing protein [Aliivibrio]MDD9179182.1 DUF1611 domain-containing protein [Aliivibrio sp. A6]OCH44007.1 EBNA-1 nuclear protein [Aliivibrio fischeri]OED53630.1 EBNA-1 nuclear protein [Aliivibrio fischeri]RYU52886.1 DUF1611 domain-containing protein [Aliivibrio finisterrensis]RYU54611.1 DUF1611 domain-containing protein [Aliivibrio finisterrensis]
MSKLNQSYSKISLNSKIELDSTSKPFDLLFSQINPITPTAIIYCEGHFGDVDGKTANGLIRHSHNYRILSVIDSKKAGLDSGEVLGEEKNGIPIVSDIKEAVALAEDLPDYFIFGIAPSSGVLTDFEKEIVLYAMSLNMNIVSGLHEFLTENIEFIEASKKYSVNILDVRKPKDKKELKAFSGKIHKVTCPRIAVMGTDCAIGKRTTATILTKILREKGLKVIMIATGQTGIIQGAPYSVALDAVPSQFCAGELEAVIVEAYEKENPDLIIIEGQGSLSHPAFSTSAFILRGSCPTGVILQHAPKRLHRSDFPEMPMPSVASEVELIEMFSNTSVIGLTLNHEGMSAEEVALSIQTYSAQLNIPVTDALAQPADDFLNMMLTVFPALEKNMIMNT